jgi:hypothetical protein
MRFTYDITDLMDLYNEGNYCLVEAIKTMRREVQNNNIIVIEQKCVNAATVELFRFIALEALDNWIRQQFPNLDID